MDFVFKVQWLRETALPASRTFCRGCNTPMLPSPPSMDGHKRSYSRTPPTLLTCWFVGVFFPLFYKECRNLLLLDGSEMSFPLQHCPFQSGAESAASRAVGELQGSTRQGAPCVPAAAGLAQGRDLGHQREACREHPVPPGKIEPWGAGGHCSGHCSRAGCVPGGLTGTVFPQNLSEVTECFE